MARKQKRRSSVLLILLLLFFAIVCAVAAVKIRQIQQERAVGTQTYADLADSIVAVQPTQTTQVPAAEAEQEAETPTETAETSVIVDFDALQAISSQGVGWIMSDDGIINYPVMQGTDNDYYLTHLADGTYNSNGSIFVDFRNAADFSDRNTIVYGHNMRNGTMFASLNRYSDWNYRSQHPELLLITPDGSFSLQVFGGCVVPGNSDLYQLSFRDDEEFLTYVEKIRIMSDFSADVQVRPEDRIVTLSTCSYNYEDARYLLFCKLIPMQ